MAHFLGIALTVISAISLATYKITSDNAETRIISATAVYNLQTKLAADEQRIDELEKVDAEIKVSLKEVSDKLSDVREILAARRTK